MLQRIQTVYLLLIVALMAAMMFMSLASIQLNNKFYNFDVSGIIEAGSGQMVYSTWALFALTAVITLVAMITIFLYKKRILQIRLCIFNGLLMLFFYGLFVFYYMQYGKVVEGMGGTEMSMSLKIALVFPLISVILDYLAIRNIGADEALVRSLERLR